MTVVPAPALPAVRPARRPGPPGRLALLLLGGACLLVELDAGLLLLGLPAPVTAERLLEVHAQLMLVGFLGTLISLERAIASRRPWGYLAPISTGVGALLMLTALPLVVGQAVQAAGLAVLVGVYAVVWRRAGSTALAIQWLGAFLAVGGALLWIADVPTATVFPWLAGFLVLTIAGERLELAHIAAPPPAAERALLLISCAIAASAAASVLWPTPGSELFGAFLLSLVAWLLTYDVARRTVHAHGLPRFTAVNLLLGMFWLGVAAVTWIVRGPLTDGPGYDIVIHAIGLGFAMSMVLAHAPIILPAILLRPLPYRPVLYIPTIALQSALLVRFAGDLREVGWAWQAGGAGTVAALLLVAGTVAVLVVRR
ncbi:MAG: hypothetical protein GC156_12875 [Actinomycetales bacterium]|nr:hypothetical protein [Actinomycetales bacterium]